MSSFPYKLHQLLTDIEKNEELSSIISWLPSGNGFRIHQPVVFETVLLKKYFPRQSKLKSFKRQVQYYGFENMGKGSYSHQCFVRGKRNLCGKIIHKLPMKTSASKKSTTAKNIMTNVKVVSRSPSPAATGMVINTNSPIVTGKVSPTPVFSNNNNLPMLHSQAFVMSPVVSCTKGSEHVIPTGQNFSAPIFPMFTMNQKNNAAAFPTNTTHQNNNFNLNPAMALNNFQQQAMQEYLKLLLSR